MDDDPLKLISIDPAVCHGQPCIKGTRVMVTVVLDALAAGLNTDEILRHYSTLTPEGRRAAVAYGAWLAKTRDPPAHTHHVRLKLDENITVAASDPLVATGHDVDTVPEEHLTGRPDPDVLGAAINDERALVTFDLGFGDPAPTRPAVIAA